MRSLHVSGAFRGITEVLRSALFDITGQMPDHNHFFGIVPPEVNPHAAERRFGTSLPQLVMQEFRLAAANGIFQEPILAGDEEMPVPPGGKKFEVAIFNQKRYSMPNA